MAMVGDGIPTEAVAPESDDLVPLVPFPVYSFHAHHVLELAVRRTGTHNYPGEEHPELGASSRKAELAGVWFHTDLPCPETGEMWSVLGAMRLERSSSPTPAGAADVAVVERLWEH